MPQTSLSTFMAFGVFCKHRGTRRIHKQIHGEHSEGGAQRRTSDEGFVRVVSHTLGTRRIVLSFGLPQSSAHARL